MALIGEYMIKRLTLLFALACAVRSLAVRAESLALVSCKKLNGRIEDQCAEGNLSDTRSG